jgi:hypothetical protein
MSARPRPDLDPFATLVHLRGNGSALSVAWTPDIFRRLAMGDGDRVIGSKRGAVPTDVAPAHGTRHRPVGPRAATGRRPSDEGRPVNAEVLPGIAP